MPENTNRYIMLYICCFGEHYDQRITLHTFILEWHFHTKYVVYRGFLKLGFSKDIQYHVCWVDRNFFRFSICDALPMFISKVLLFLSFAHMKDGWMNGFRPLLRTVKAELGQGQPGLMRWIWDETLPQSSIDRSTFHSAAHRATKWASGRPHAHMKESTLCNNCDALSAIRELETSK